MGRASRESRLNAAFVMVADTLTADYDVVNLLHSLLTECTAIVKVQAGGLMLADRGGNLQVMASTSESANLVELMQLSAGSGPCIQCFTTGEVVSVPDIAASTGAWSAFRDAALREGFLSVHAIPMTLRGDTIGAMNLFGAAAGALSKRDAAAARALADVATIAILHERVASQAQVVTEQLQKALDSRVLIEQAKGAISQATGMTMDKSFNVLRRYARNHNLTIHAASEGLTDRTISIATLAGATERSLPTSR